jgi:hypothetical protein
MVTANFASTILNLSPADQPESRFRYFGRQTFRDRECDVVGFAQDPERTRRAGHLYSSPGESQTILVQGLAWIDSQTFQILRVVTWLLAPREDIGLATLTSTVDFYPVRPIGSERVLRLPRDVEVDVFYHGMRIRNTHHYSNYKLFRVESTIRP